MPRVCLVTSRHLAYNPRLYKEACALDDAGVNVRVVAPNLDPEKSALDDELMETETWTLDRVSVQRRGAGQARWMKGALRQRLLQTVPVLQRLPYGVELAYSRHVDALYRTAVALSADLYVAHNLQALPAATWAAEKTGAQLGFDAEDFHRGEFPHDDLDSPERALTMAVEAEYLPRCDHLTAASPGIADAYAEALPIDRPNVILNVFPLSERSGHTPPEELAREAPDDAYSLYWYSQTIGPDRGLQDVVRALPNVQVADQPVILSLRGSWSGGFEATLRQLARDHGVADHIRHLPPVPPDQLVERAAEHDVGLALEQPVSKNREICITNKLFAYLLAGLPVVATNTLGQKPICADLSECTRICPPEAPETLACAIRSFLQSPKHLQHSSQAAYTHGSERFNWDIEQKHLLCVFGQTLNTTLQPCSATA